MIFTIRQSRAADAPHLPAIERSAGNLFRAIPELAWIADGDDVSVQRHLEFIADGTSWVAETRDGHLIAFLCAQPSGDALHIWEWSVLLDHQRLGIGRALMSQAINFARRRRLAAITLTTFRAVPWNEPAYQKMGFVTLRADEHDPRLGEILAREVSHGFPADRRCAMRMSLPETSGSMSVIRRSRLDDGERTIDIWRAAVDATHHFLTPEDRRDIDREVRNFLPQMPLWLAVDEHDRAIAFMGLTNSTMDALFVHPDHRGRGVGRSLVEHALKLQPVLRTDVNEQNEQALRFYERLGFVRYGRSAIDAQGRLYPLLHLEIDANVSQSLPASD